jgi:hypothetical protein
VGWVVTLPSIRLLLEHCILEHDVPNEAGVQYRLRGKRKWRL